MTLDCSNANGTKLHYTTIAINSPGRVTQRFLKVHYFTR